MSEYWVSKKKYFCRYCDIYIADDAPSRQQHENGLRHQGNKARFVREIYKTGERRKRDEEDEQRELARVEQAANEAYAKDIASGATVGSGSAASTSRTPPTRPSSSTTRRTALSGDLYSNYSTAEQLGFVDEEDQRAAAEKALKMTEGRIGEWTIVPVQLPPVSAAEPTPAATAPAAVQALHEGADDDIRGWKFKRRRIAAGLDDIYDPGIIEVKKEKEGRTPPPEPKAEEGSAGSVATELPKWTPRGWLKPGEAPPRATPPEGGTAQNEPEMAIKKEGESAPLPVEPSQSPNAEPLPPAMKVEELEVPKLASAPEPPPSTGLFRKRKALGSGAGSRGSRR